MFVFYSGIKASQMQHKRMTSTNMLRLKLNIDHFNGIAIIATRHYSYHHKQRKINRDKKEEAHSARNSNDNYFQLKLAN